MIEKRGRPLAYHSLTYEELGQYVGAWGMVPVKKSWLENLGFQFDEEDSEELPCHTDKRTKETTPEIKYSITRFE
jgi:hypothetical protein